VFLNITTTKETTQTMTITHFSNQSNKKSASINKTLAKDVIEQTFNDIKRSFPKRRIDELAWETGFIKRASAKIGGFDFLVSLLVASLDPAHSSLEKLSEIFRRINRFIKVSPQALMEKINSQDSVQFLETIFKNHLKDKMGIASENLLVTLDFFSKVLIQDSTVIQLNEALQEHFKGSGGRASRSFAKLDVIYDYKSKNYERIKLTDQGEADQKLSHDIVDALTEKALVIRDLGYFNVSSLKQIISKNAFFLSRLKLNLKVFLSKEDENEIDLFHYMEKYFRNCQVMDLQVFVTDEKLPVRLVASKAPEDFINKRRREARATAKKQGRTLTEKTLKLMSLTIFITNVPKEVWNSEMLFIIYKVRWQIELIFKCWKSRLQISYLRGINPERIKCLIYSRLILILIVNRIYKLTEFIGNNLLDREISLPKVFEWIRDTERLIKIIKGWIQGWETRFFIDTILISMCTQKRTRKSTFKHIWELDLCC
jgi:uncharacterized membrane protein YobD (UPF0266 family)